MKLLGPADYKSMLWKNGRGTTRELAVSPADSALNGKPFAWRVSIADVESDCEFSTFPGYDRSLILTEGAGMELVFDAAPAVEIRDRYTPVRFSGDWHARCRLLNAGVRDFNVMTVRAQLSHTCEVVRRHPYAIAWQPRSETLMVYCCKGGVTLNGLDGGQLGVEAEHALLLQPHAGAAASASLQMSGMSGDAVVLAIRIFPLTQVRHG